MICPTPPTDIVEHPERNDDCLSNAPMPEPSNNSDEPKSGSIQFSFDPSNVGPDCTGKRGRGRTRKNEKPDRSNKGALNTSGSRSKHGRRHPLKSEAPSISQPKTPDKHGRACPQKSEPISNQFKTPAKHGRGRPPKSKATDSRQPVSSEAPCKSDAGSPCQCEGSDGLPQSKVPKLNTPTNPSVNSTINNSCAQFQQTMHILLGGTSPPSILSAMLSLNSVQSIIVALNGMGVAIEAIVQTLNTLPVIFANNFPRLPIAFVHFPI